MSSSCSASPFSTDSFTCGKSNHCSRFQLVNSSDIKPDYIIIETSGLYLRQWCCINWHKTPIPTWCCLSDFNVQCDLTKMSVLVRSKKTKSTSTPAYLKAMLLWRHPHQPLSCPVGLAGSGEHRIGGRRPWHCPRCEEAGDIVGTAPRWPGHGSTGTE